MTVDTDTTTIQLSRKTRLELTNLGKKGETYDEIIKKLLSNWSEGGL